MANDWKEQMANEFVALANDKTLAPGAAATTIAARLNTLVAGVIDRSKSDHAAAAKEAAAKDAEAAKARQAEIDAAVAEPTGDKPAEGKRFWNSEPATPAWAASKAHEVGDKVQTPNGAVIVASQAGTTGEVAPTWTISDGTAVWSIG